MYTEREIHHRKAEDTDMNDKLARQIEEMKTQSIGDEVEMDSITPETTARIGAVHFGTRR